MCFLSGLRPTVSSLPGCRVVRQLSNFRSFAVPAGLSTSAVVSGSPASCWRRCFHRRASRLSSRTKRRCAFLLRAVDAMDLTNVEYVNRHAQRWTEESTSAELVTARALGRLRVMVRLSAPLLEMGGTAVIFGKPKREAAKETEAEEVARAVGLRPVTVARNGAGRYRLASSLRVREGGRHADADKCSRLVAQAGGGANADTCGRGRQGGVERCRTARAGRDRVRRLEASGAAPDNAAELDRARAVVQKMERRLAVLTQRRARAEGRLERSESGLGKDEIGRVERPRRSAVFSTTTSSKSEA